MLRPQIFRWYTYLYALLPLISIFGLFVRNGLVISFIGLLSAAVSLTYMRIASLRFRLDFTELLVYLTFLYAILIYIINDFGVEYYSINVGFIASSISYLFVPMICAHILTINLNTDYVLNVVFKSILFSLMVSLVLHVFKPRIYFDFISRNVLEDIGLGDITFFPRFFGIYGSSMIIGCLSSLSLVFALYKVGSFNARFYLPLVMFSIFCSIISMQRGSWLVSFMSIILFFLFKGKIRLLILVSALFLLVGFILFQGLENLVPDDNLTSYFLQRWSDLFDAVGERDYQWIYALNKFYENPLGYGLGTFSHKAVSIHGQNAVTDGNYMRILVESGFIGFLIFVFLIGRSFFKLLLKKRYLLFQLLYVFVMLAFGTNVFDLYYTSYLFYVILFLAR